MIIWVISGVRVKFRRLLFSGPEEFFTFSNILHWICKVIQNIQLNQYL